MNAEKIVFLVGAGMSTSAGIADFRSKSKDRFGMDLFHRITLEHDPQRMHNFVSAFLSKNYQPTKAHQVIKGLEDRGSLVRVLTQNIDGLEEKAGIDSTLISQLHGSLQQYRCCDASCNGQLSASEYAAIAEKTMETPRCYMCNGESLMRPDILLYGEEMNQNLETSAMIDFNKCDLFVCVGTSLKVNPVASWPRQFLESSSAIRVWVNLEPPPPNYANFFQIVIQDNCDDALSMLFNL